MAILTGNLKIAKITSSSLKDITKKKVQFTDYKKAHTDTTLIDINSINHTEYNNLEELERERSKKLNKWINLKIL